jgi:Bd3614-like deaminase
MARRHHLPWAPDPADRAIAEHLGPGAAFLRLQDEVLSVRGGVLELALAVWEWCPDQAHATLRRRVRVTSPPDELDRAAAQVVARRVSAVEPAPGPLPAPVRDLSSELERALDRSRAAALDPGVDQVPADEAAFLRALIPPAEDRPRVERDRPVAAVLLGDGGRVVSAARNAGAHNRVLHAEVGLVLAYGGSLAGMTVLTSLQPCRLCAALLVRRAGEGPLAVRYLEADPGRLATETALQRRGWERPIAGQSTWCGQ